MTEQAVTTDESTERNRRRTRTATVVSDRMEKTVVVQVSSLKQHPLYKKTIQRRVKFKADPNYVQYDRRWGKNA